MPAWPWSMGGVAVDPTKIELSQETEGAVVQDPKTPLSYEFIETTTVGDDAVRHFKLTATPPAATYEKEGMMDTADDAQEGNMTVSWDMYEFTLPDGTSRPRLLIFTDRIGKAPSR